ncbi:universal stress protein [Longitalea luteola]|uniref:universal stress protein n=1 Tax=Longitalea luteola TaxID=2812563 RepID=UPI001A96F017|nr:universal stress protein [Longitalea luteola]
MIKSILVPTDYSEASLNALKTAIKIAAGNNATLYILHVKDVIPEAVIFESKKKAKEVFDAMAGKLSIEHGIQTTIIFADGIVGHTIVNTVAENKIDLVIMGSHGLPGQGGPAIGSNAYYVVKRCTCPVMLIPEGPLRIDFKNILFPVRPSKFTYKLYRIIENIAVETETPYKVQILGITTSRFETTLFPLPSKIREITNNNGNNNIEISLSYSNNINISNSVLAGAEESNADLIVISPGIDMPARPFFIGPSSQNIINQAKIPILSIIRISEN